MSKRRTRTAGGAHDARGISSTGRYLGQRYRALACAQARRGPPACRDRGGGIDPGGCAAVGRVACEGTRRHPRTGGARCLRRRPADRRRGRRGLAASCLAGSELAAAELADAGCGRGLLGPDRHLAGNDDAVSPIGRADERAERHPGYRLEGEKVGDPRKRKGILLVSPQAVLLLVSLCLNVLMGSYIAKQWFE